MNDLDAEELFHLALKASEDGDRDRTIRYLKQSIELDPKAESIYLLAAEYAEIGMMQRSIEGMQQALQLNPELWTAYFQLGLIFLTEGLIQEARNAWEPLTQQSPEEYLFHLGTGLIQLVDDQTEEGLESLKIGISLNQENPALNRDVTSIIDNVYAQIAERSEPDEAGEQEVPVIAQAAAETQPADEDEASQKQHLFLSKYGDDSGA